MNPIHELSSSIQGPNRNCSYHPSRLKHLLKACLQSAQWFLSRHNCWGQTNSKHLVWFLAQLNTKLHKQLPNLSVISIRVYNCKNNLHLFNFTNFSPLYHWALKASIKNQSHYLFSLRSLDLFGSKILYSDIKCHNNFMHTLRRSLLCAL